MPAAASVGSISVGRSPAKSRATCPARSLSSSTTWRHASGPGAAELSRARAGAVPTRATVASMAPAVITGRLTRPARACRRARTASSGAHQGVGQSEEPLRPPRAGDRPPSALEGGALGAPIERGPPAPGPGPPRAVFVDLAEVVVLDGRPTIPGGGVGIGRPLPAGAPRGVAHPFDGVAQLGQLGPGLFGRSGTGVARH